MPGSVHVVREQFRDVGYPALVLHGGDDLNTPANSALTAYRASGPTGNDDVQQAAERAVGAVGLAGFANR